MIRVNIKGAVMKLPRVTLPTLDPAALATDAIRELYYYAPQLTSMLEREAKAAAVLVDTLRLQSAYIEDLERTVKSRQEADANLDKRPNRLRYPDPELQLAVAKKSIERLELALDDIAGTLHETTSNLKHALRVLEPFATFASAPSFDRLPKETSVTKGSGLAHKQVTVQNFLDALDVYRKIQPNEAVGTQ